MFCCLLIFWSCFDKCQDSLISLCLWERRLQNITRQIGANSIKAFKAFSTCNLILDYLQVIDILVYFVSTQICFYLFKFALLNIQI